MTGSTWPIAIRRALLLFLVALAAAELLVILLAVSAQGQAPGPAAVAGSGSLLFLAFHRVDLAFEVPRSLFPSVTAPVLPPLTSVGVGLAPLAATAMIAWSLAVGGRAVARARPDAGSLERALRGAQVAVPYAVLTFAVSFVSVRLNQPGAEGIRVHADHVGALLWPLVLAAVAGAAGGLRAAAQGGDSPLVRRLRAVLAGGWRMLWVGLVLSFLGLLVVAATRPDDTRSFLAGAFAGGPLRGVALIGLTALAVPNMAAWILFPAMGACTGVEGAFRACLLSYGRFPGEGLAIPGPPFPAGPVELTTAPPGYYAFLVVPVVAVLVGGAFAARRGAASTRVEAAALGAGAGVVFAAMSLVVILAARATLSAGGGQTAFFGAAGLAMGPLLQSSALVAVGWGLAGGAVGGLLASARGGFGLPGPQDASDGDRGQEDQADPRADGGEVPQHEHQLEQAGHEGPGDQDGAG
ncbi:MAG TPA: DUF6350 family protein [Actinomycetota bacterium]|nr:DUF6350 family protein [Actinomycetota bacterium]